MPDKYKGEDPIESYRKYYAGDKYRLAVWTRRDPPEWLEPLREKLINEGVVDPNSK